MITLITLIGSAVIGLVVSAIPFIVGLIVVAGIVALFKGE